jgi:hypothetical protein
VQYYDGLHIIVENFCTQQHPSVKSRLKCQSQFHLQPAPMSSSWLNLVEGGFREITEKCLRRGSFACVPSLIAAIEEFLANNSQNPRVFIWSAPVNQISTKIAKCKKALDALH